MKTARQSKSSRKAPLMASLTLACAMFAGNAGAGGIPVIDGLHMTQSTYGHLMTKMEAYAAKIQDAAEYGKTAERWTEEVRQFQEALSKLNGMLSNVQNMNMNDRLEKVPLSYGVEDACPSGSLLSMEGLVNSIMSAVNPNDWRGKQQELCQRIVAYQNTKYNTSVDILMKMKERMEEIESLDDEVVAGEDDEASKSSTAAYLSAINVTMTELQYGQARLSAYDSMIASLQVQQNNLAKKVLKGDPLGDLVNATLVSEILD